MRILAIDTALETCAAAVLDTARGELLAEESIPMVRGHAEALMPLVARVMQEAGLRFLDLDRIAVTQGPGSFTGLRVGVSAARGIALAADRPAFGLTTLAAYAAPFIAADDQAPVVVAIDARHGHVYLQAFSAGGKTVISPRIASLAEAAEATADPAVRIVGNAAELVEAARSERWPPAFIVAQPSPDIGWVARLGAAAIGDPAPPRPLYLRAPDAQPQDASRLARR